VRSSPAVGGDGVVYVGSNGNRIYALEPFTGDVLWQRPTGGDVASSPAIGPNGRLYVGSDDDRLYALSDEGQTAAVRVELESSSVDDAPLANGCQCSMARQPRPGYLVSLVAGIALALGVRRRRSR
jgi:MYXO-CTERM domain-containing protein